MAKIVTALCTSHSPYLFAPGAEWSAARAARENAPHAFAPGYPRDSEQANEEKSSRCVSAMQRMRDILAAAKPDVLLVFGDDQLEQFSFKNFPALCIFTGEEFSGFKISPYKGLPVSSREREKQPHTPEHWVTVKSHPQLAKHLMKELVKSGFNMAFSNEVNDHGIGHAFTRPFVHLRPAYDIPIIPIYINCYYGPQPTGARCYALGRAIAKIIEDFPEDLRVGVLGSGGLWHTPMMKHAHIDSAFDSAILDAVRSGDARRMAEEFDTRAPRFDPKDEEEVTRLSAGTGMVLGQGSGTGETRNWIAAAAVVDGLPGEVIDYVEIHASPVGAGFAAWTPQ